MTITTSGPIETGSTATTYSELQQQVSDFLARSDLADFIPTFINMAEDWFNYGTDDMAPLRVREMEEVEELEPTSGACDVPDDFLQHIRAVEVGSIRRVLSYITPDQAEFRHATRDGGIPVDFTIVGSSLYMFPLSSNDIELTYYAKIPQLVTAETNWLLQKAPTLYLRATLAVAADFIKDNEEAAKNLMLTKALMAGLNRSDMIGRYARAGYTGQGYWP
ncbi:MAG TPA: hypothetical protein VEG32_07840 [Clostridia bacterium]|nr:hypothetical protein [Clostridia bacterium]